MDGRDHNAQKNTRLTLEKPTWEKIPTTFFLEKFFSSTRDTSNGSNQL